MVHRMAQSDLSHLGVAHLTASTERESSTHQGDTNTLKPCKEES